MTLQRMDNVLIVVEDLEAAKAFSAELEGETQVEGLRWTVRLDGARPDIATMGKPDGHGRVEPSDWPSSSAERASPEVAEPTCCTVASRRESDPPGIRVEMEVLAAIGVVLLVVGVHLFAMERGRRWGRKGKSRDPPWRTALGFATRGRRPGIRSRYHARTAGRAKYRPYSAARLPTKVSTKPNGCAKLIAAGRHGAPLVLAHCDTPVRVAATAPNRRKEQARLS